MLRYFPNNYSWSQSVNICLSGGGQINEIDEACAPLKEVSKHEDQAAQSAWHESWKKLADRIESGEVACDRITLIAGSSVYCWGPVSQDRAAEGAVFDMTWGIHYMMGLPVKVQLEMDGD